MELKTIYSDIEAIISAVDFSLLWRDFKPMKFALYNETECYFDGEFIAKTDVFIANTAIEYNGEYIAIWNFTDEIDPAILASKLIHEMFHAFQMMNHETRFPRELEALVKYGYSAENLSLKLQENQLIAKLTRHFEASGFAQLLSLRKYRLVHFEYDYRYEAAIEQIEGTASYVELDALKQISKDKYQRELDALLEDICDYRKMLPIRIISYSVGAMFFMLLKENNIVAFNAFSDEPTAVPILKNVTAYHGTMPSVAEMDAAVNAYHRQTDEIVTNALVDAHCVAQGEFDLLALNVYNARYHGQYIVSYYFVMYADEGKETVLYGDFVIEMNDNKKAIRIIPLK